MPARPEIARGIGLDAMAWAREGLIDRLVVGPYKGTTDFDVPVERWQRLLAGTGVPVTVCLEYVASFYPGAPNRWTERWGMTGEQCVLLTMPPRSLRSVILGMTVSP